MTEYVVYDVFTKEAFGGNQLAVFPDARGLPEDLLQKITAEFNFSEVTFVYPPKQAKHTARVRIFTPTSEVDFAGHPTIGTAVALANLGYESPMILELGIGPLSCTADQQSAAFTAMQPLQKITEPEPSLVAAALGLSLSDITKETHAPIQASLGLPFVLAELSSLNALAVCDPKIEIIKDAAKKYPAGNDFALFAYVRDGENITSRMFAPLDNIPEDPATGSASATLAALLTELSGGDLSLTFSQGGYMNRPSQILVSTTHNPASVTTSGSAVQTMQGRFIL